MTRIPKFNTENHDVCRGCTLKKYSKNTFPNNNTRAVGILDLVHYDLCRTMSSSSLKGFDYYIIFVDEFSRKTLQQNRPLAPGLALYFSAF